jgi:probable rRNA maturation factor
MKIFIRDLQKRIKTDKKKIKEWMETILRELAFQDGELSILLVDDEEITRLNQRYLKRNRPTNVISFPMKEGEMSHIHPEILGDIVVSIDSAEREAKMIRIPFEKRLLMLLIHGFLHLIGYDHEGNEDKAREMEKKEMELLLKCWN